MNKQEYMNCAEKELLHTYNRFPVVLEKGEGVYPVSYTHLHIEALKKYGPSPIHRKSFIKNFI